MKKIFPLFIILVFISACSIQKKEIARWEGGNLFLSDLSEEELALPFKMKVTLMSNKAFYVLFLEEARKKGYDELPELLNRLEQQKKLLIREYVTNNIFQDKIPTLHRKDLKKYTSTISMDYIWLNAPLTLDEYTRANKRKIAREAWGALKKGTNFNYLADRITDDQGNFRGGFFGAFTESQMDSDFFSAVRKLKPGDISPVITAQDGLHILKLEKVDAVSGRYVLSRIFFALEGGQTNKTALANRIHELLQQDPDRFSRLANRYSEDPANKKGGIFPPFTFTSKPFVVSESVYRTGEGKRSKVIENRYGYFLFQVRKIDHLSAKDLRQKWKNKKFRSDLERVVQRRHEIMNRAEAMEKYKTRLYRISDVIKDYSLFTNRTRPAPSQVLLKILPINRIITWQEYETLADRLNPALLTGKTTYIERVQFFERYLALPELIYTDGIGQGLLKKPQVQSEIQDIQDRLVFEFYQNDLADIGSISEAELREQYELRREEWGNRPFELVRDKLYQERKQELIRSALLTARERLIHASGFRIITENLQTREDKQYETLRKKAREYSVSGSAEKAAAFLLRARKLKPEDPSLYPDFFRIYDSFQDPFKAQEFIGIVRDENAVQMRIMEDFLDDPATQTETVRFLAELGQREAILPLLKRLDASNGNFKADIIRALGRLRAVHASDKILEIVKQERLRPLKENGNVVLLSGIDALGYIGNERTAQYFRNWLMQEKDDPTRIVLIEGLGRLRDKGSVLQLESLLEDPVWGVRVIAGESLKDITGREYPVESPPVQK